MAIDPAALSPNPASTIEQDVVQAVEKAPQPWPLLFLGVAFAAGLLAIGYLLVEIISYNNATAGLYLNTVAQWLGLTTLVGGAILVPSPVSKK